MKQAKESAPPAESLQPLLDQLDGAARELRSSGNTEEAETVEKAAASMREAVAEDSNVLSSIDEATVTVTRQVYHRSFLHKQEAFCKLSWYHSPATSQHGTGGAEETVYREHINMVIESHLTQDHLTQDKSAKCTALDGTMISISINLLCLNCLTRTTL